MILLGLALLTQTVGLPANTAEAARLCGSSSNTWAGTPAEKTSLSAFFALTASRETHGSKPIGGHIGAEAQIIAEGVARADPKLQDACRKRFPLAFVARVTLPRDSFERRLACLMASGFARGMMEHLNDDALNQKYTAANERFLSLIEDKEFQDHGVSTQEEARAMADHWLGELATIGNPIAIVATCEAAFPA